MQPYQEEYLQNCETIRRLSDSHFADMTDFDKAFRRAAEDMRRARELTTRNTQLLQEELLPLLDTLYMQETGVLAELEEFADALTKGPKAIDVVLACQLHQALLTCARYRGRREDVIRELYKLGMARYGLWFMLTGLEIPDAISYTTRMRYCFVEAGSYLKYFEEFQDDETRGYILRSVANVYLGTFEKWEDKLACVRHTMQVFRDERYRAAAPGLPWEAYLRAVHRQMASVVPYNLVGGSLSPDDVADVMESAHLVYESKYEDIRHNGQNVKAHDLLPYYAVEFSCGLITKEELLRDLERLMDEADPAKYDAANLYQIVSLPAYYAQYLRMMPEQILPRRRYIIQLYERLVRYVNTMPNEAITDVVRLYVRQVMSEFVEVEGGPSYRELLLFLLARFAPELYAHGYVTARMAQALCETIFAGDPGYFDDIPEVAAASSSQEKREIVLDQAYASGMLHDVGKINFSSLYDQQGRQRVQSEEEILSFHANAGWLYLKERESTRRFADAALGHHRWYDGSEGFPAAFHRNESPYRAMVDVIAFADFMDGGNDEDGGDRDMSFEERLSAALKLEGRRFSPLVTGWLRTPELLDRLRPIYKNGRRDGLYHCFCLFSGKENHSKA